MMLLKNNSKSLIKSILFLIFGALVFAYPDKVISIASSVFGAILILYGLFMIVKNYYETKHDSNTPATVLTFGIIFILIGIMFVILSDSISLVIQYVIGAWILFNGIERLIMSLSLPKHTNTFISQLVISILLLSAGLYTILVSNITIQVVGAIMIAYAILEIIGFFTANSIEVEKQEEKKENKSKKKENNKKIEVKEAKVIEDKSNKK